MNEQKKGSKEDLKAKAHEKGAAVKAQHEGKAGEMKGKIEKKPNPNKTSEGKPEDKKVKMIFTDDKFYKDPNVIYFKKGVVYEVEGEDQIQRWVKRGGKILNEGEKPPVEGGEVPPVEGEVPPVEGETPVEGGEHPADGNTGETPVVNPLKSGEGKAHK